MAWSIVIAVVSLIYSVYSSMEAAKKARAARREAERRADEAKGFQVPAEAVSKSLPLLFGRNLIGGVRVYHNTFNTYAFAAAAADCTVFDPGTNMGASIGGEKHEYLAVQQVLSCGELNRIISVDVDQMAYTTEEYKHGMRIHVYRKGGVADPLMTAMDSDRSLSKFPGMPYLTGVFRLNRDNPQYNGVPTIQVYAEGTPVENVEFVGGSYVVTTPTYSNNPARCLLHYMLNTKYGRGAPVNTLDLKSFFDAIKICEHVVVTNTNKDGRYWTSSVVSAESRNLKIYEANMAIDTGKKIRENIEELLSTMPGSELVWANGVYSLQLLSPFIYKPAVTYDKGDVVQISDGRVFKSVVDVNTNQSLLSSLDTNYWVKHYSDVTDDDIIIEKGIETSHPNAQTRLNSASISFLNEAKDFTEDSVSWPSKTGFISPHNLYLGTWDANRVYQKGDIVLHIGIYYQLSTGVNRQNVNQPNSDTAWKVCATPSQKIAKGAWNASLTYTTGDLVTYNGNTYQLTDGIVRVNSATPAVDTAWHLTTDTVYAELRAADSQMSLETTSFGKGVVSYYNALAMAEQVVRESRSNIIYKLTVKRSLMSLIPGSLIYVNSVLLNIPGEMMKVFGVEVLSTGDITISAVKFDAATFAWNVADTEIVKPRNIFDNSLGKAISLTMDLVTTRVMPETIARLTWTRPMDIRVSSYLVKYTLDAVPTSTSAWNVIGRTSNSFIEIPFLNGLHATFVVISETANGRIDNWSTWPYLRYDTATIPFSNISGLGYEVLNDGILLKISKSYSNLALSYEVRRAVLNAATPGWDDVTNVPVEIISGNSVKVEFLPIGTTKFLVKVRTRDNISSGTMETLAITVTAPAAPAVTTQVIDNNVLFYWTDSVSQQPIDTYELRKGSNYATAQVIGTKSGLFTSIFETQAGTYDYWIVAIDKGGNYGTPTKTTVRVAQPPDYNMVRNTPSMFANTANQFVAFTNAAASDILVLPVNTIETVANHMALYTTANASIAAGNPYMLQPVPASGVYQEILDFGVGFDATLAIIKVTATMTILEQVAGCSYQMYVSKSVDNVTYSTELASDTIFASGFRYIKFRLVVTSDTKGFMRISGIRYNADTKLKNESGMKTCNAADSGGTTVTFNTAFFDVASIDVTAGGTTPTTAMYDFVDAPNPTSFKILLFDSAGARVSGTASWSVKGY